MTIFGANAVGCMMLEAREAGGNSLADKTRSAAVKFATRRLGQLEGPDGES